MASIAVVRLMAWKTFVYRGKGSRPEQQMCIEFANKLRALELEGKVKCVWTHVPNEIGYTNNKIAQTIYAAAKAMGMIVGTTDYVFLGSNSSVAMEAKSKTGKQHQGQKDFETWCVSKSVPYEIFRTADEGIEILKKHGMII